MASPQVENGFTRIADDVLEALCRAELSGAELRVVLAIIRMTWGWNTKSRSITQAQIGECTGIKDRAWLSKLTAKLAARGLITKVSTWGKPTSYSPNKDYDQWVSTDKEDSTVNQTSTVNGDSTVNADSTDPRDNGSTVENDSTSTVENDSTHLIKDSTKDMVQTEGNHHPVRSTCKDDDDDDSKSLFIKLWVPGRPDEMTWELFHAAREEIGEEALAGYLKECGRRNVRRQNVLPYVERCVRNQAAGAGVRTAGERRRTGYGL